MSSRWRRAVFVALAGLSISIQPLAGGSTASAAATAVVSTLPSTGWSTFQGWCASGSPTGHVDLVNGPSTPPAGAGSLEIAVGDNGWTNVGVWWSGLNRRPVSDLQGATYSTYVRSLGSGLAPKFALLIDKDGNGAMDGSLVFAPPSGQLLSGTWQTWDAAAGPWTEFAGATSPPVASWPTLAAYTAAHPATRFAGDVNGIVISEGCGDPAWAAFTGNVDAVTLAIAGLGSTLYDFESGSPVVPRAARQGYWMVGRTGDVYAFGDASWYGNAVWSGADVVDLEATPSGNGYRLVDTRGNVTTLGDATYLGGAPALAAGETVTSLSATRSGAGYWLFTTAGRVLTYGDAAFFGDMSATRLNGPVLDSIVTSSGRGYYMVASDGGIFAFGDAIFYGSMGAVRLNQPVQSLVPDPDGIGYWLVASDGGIFAFEAAFLGSMGDTALNRPVTGMVGFASGYLMVAEDGGIFSFGHAPFFGSLGDNPPSQPITSVAVLDK